MDGPWLLTDVGCLECGAEMINLGVYPDRLTVQEAVTAIDSKGFVYWSTPDDAAEVHGGQSAFVAFLVSDVVDS